MPTFSLQHAGRLQPAGDFRSDGGLRKSFVRGGGTTSEIQCTQQQLQEIIEQREGKGGPRSTEDN